MEWHWVAIIIVAFVGLVGLWIYLGKKGVISNDLMEIVRKMTASLSDLFSIVANAAPSQTIVMLDKAWDLLAMSVQAAENMWYNGEITKEERYDKCLVLFEECLELYEIELPAGYAAVVDSVIRATCEAMGHNASPKEDGAT